MSSPENQNLNQMTQFKNSSVLNSSSSQPTTNDNNRNLPNLNRSPHRLDRFGHQLTNTHQLIPLQPTLAIQNHLNTFRMATPPNLIGQQLTRMHHFSTPERFSTLTPLESAKNALHDYSKKNLSRPLAICGPPSQHLQHSPNPNQVVPYQSRPIVPFGQFYGNSQLQSVRRSLHQLNVSELNPISRAPINYVTQNVIRRMSKTTIPKLDTKQVRGKLENIVNKKPSKKSRIQLPYFSMSFAVLIFVSGTFVYTGPIAPIIYDLAIKYAALNPSGIITYFWRQPPIGVKVCIFLMGVQNGQEFVDGAKPHIVEHGPFCYYLTIRFDIEKWREDIVEVYLKLNFDYMAQDSAPLDTPIRFINLPIFAAIFCSKSFMEDHYLSFFGPVVYNVIMVALRASGDRVIEDITAYNIFENYKIRVLDYIEMFLLKPLRMVGVPIPMEHEFKILSFSLKNWSFGVARTLSSGRIGPLEFYRRTTLKNNTYISELKTILGVRSFMDNPMCMKNRGVKVYKALLHPMTADRLLLNIPFFCREFWVAKRYEHRFYGTPVTRYSLDEQMYNQSQPENRCYCRRKAENRGECQGWHDMSQCIISAPFGFSFPQFYKSPTLLRTVTGLKPDPVKHDSYFEMETNLGVPLDAYITLQIVLDVTPVRSVLALRKLPSVRLPIFWLRVHYGAFGILGYLVFVLCTLYRYGSYLWLLTGFALSTLFVILGLRQRGLIQVELNVFKLVSNNKAKLYKTFREHRK